MDDKTLSLILRLTLDGQSQQNFKAGVEGLKKTLGEMRKVADEARKALNDALAKGDSEGAKRLQRSLEDIEAKIGDVEEQARDTFAKNFVDAAKKASNEMRELSERAGEVTRAIGLAGSAVVVGMAAAANNYATQTGQAERASRQWLSTSSRLEQANLRLGKASAQALQPWYDKLAAISEKAAGFAERNPGSVSGLAAAGIAAAGVGGLGEAAVQGVKLVADVKLLAAAALQKQAADTMLKAAGVQAGASKLGAGGKLLGGLPLVGSGLAVAGLAGATALVGGLGYAAYEGLRGTAYGKNLKPGVGGMVEQAGTSLVQIGGIGAVGLAKLSDAIGITGNAAEVTARMLPGLIDRVKNLGKESDEAAAQVKKLTPDSEEFQLYRQYLADEQEAKNRAAQQISDAEQRAAGERSAATARTEEERTRITEQYGERRADLERTYEEQRTETLASQAKARVRAEQDLERSLNDMAASYVQQQAQVRAGLNEQLEKIDADARKARIDALREHQKRLLQLEQDHDGRVRDLVASRDALGLANENERYAQAKANENSNFRDQLGEIKRDAAEQRAAARAEQAKALEDLARNYQQQRQKAIEQFQFQQQRQAEDDAETLAKMDAKHAAELAKMDAQQTEELRKLDEKHAAELRQIDENTRQTLAKLRAAAAEEQRQRAAALQAQMKTLLGIQNQGQQAMLDAAQRYVDGLKQKAAQMDGVAGAATTNTPAAGAANTPASGSPTGQLIPGRAAGGPINEGLVYAHDYEYMLSRPYRTALEGELGAPLTQERLLAGVRQARGGGGASGNIINMQVTLPLSAGGITATERRQIVGDARAEIITWLDGALERMG